MDGVKEIDEHNFNFQDIVPNYKTQTILHSRVSLQYFFGCWLLTFSVAVALEVRIVGFQHRNARTTKLSSSKAATVATWTPVDPQSKLSCHVVSITNGP